MGSISTMRNTYGGISGRSDPAWKGVYRAGGLSLAAMAVIRVVDFPLFFVVGGAAGPGEGLRIIAQQRLLFQIHGVMVLHFLLLIPGILALYLALREVDTSKMLIAGAMGLLASIQVGWISPMVLSEVVLSDGYMAATSEAQRAAYVTVTDFVRGALAAGFSSASFSSFSSCSSRVR